MKRIREGLIPVYIIVNVLYIFVGSYLFTIKKISYSMFSKVYIILLITNILLIISKIIIKKIKKQKLVFNIVDISTILIIIFGVISTIFAIKPKVALYGFYNRYEGIFQICYYITLMTVCTFTKESKKKYITYIILITGLVQLVYAVLQVTDIGNITRIHNEDEIWTTGFTKNPNFFGAYMLMCSLSSIGLYIHEKKLKAKLIYLLLIFFFTIGILIASALSCLIGLVICTIYLAIKLFKTKRIKEFIIIVITLSLAVVLINMAGLSTLKKDIQTTQTETKEILKGNIKDTYGTKRVYIWKHTLKIVPKNIIHGVGIDNYPYAFNGRPLVRKNIYYDKTHNEYLQTLVTGGIFYLLSYLGLYIIAIKNGIKNKKYYLLPVIGYLIQAFFNISVIEVAPFFYINLGLLVNRYGKSERNNTST